MKSTLLAALVATLLPAAALADEAKDGAYVPGLGAIMAATQMRHAKLWLAGSAGNWELADYVLDELKEGLEDAAKYHPEFKGAPVAALLDKYIPAPLNDLALAIRDKNRAKFAQSFDSLSNACNSCHRAAQHGYIVIKRPSGNAFTNQEFAAPKR